MSQSSGGSSPTGNDFNVLAAAAHDLKTPLSLIYGLADTMQGESQPDKMQQHAQQISQTTKRVVEMIDAVVLAHRVEQTELALKLTPVDVSSVVDYAAYELTPLAQRLEHDLDIRISRRLPTAMAHKQSMQRIISGLIDVSLRLAKPKQKITVTVKRVGEMIAISVSGGGVALRPAEWQRVTSTPGSMLQPSPALGSSSGAILYIIHQLVDAMNGEFSSKNVGGKPTFFVRLPQVSQLQLL